MAIKEILKKHDVLIILAATLAVLAISDSDTALIFIATTITVYRYVPKAYAFVKEWIFDRF